MRKKILIEHSFIFYILIHNNIYSLRLFGKINFLIDNQYISFLMSTKRILNLTILLHCY